MSAFTTDAILLRKIEYGDHDLIISFLTKSNGKITAIAKNAKKSVKRFSGALDLFSANQIQCVPPKKKKDALINLTQTDLANGFVNIRYDVLKTAYASYWIELIYFWLEEGKDQEMLYELLLFSLDALNRDLIPKKVISLLFQIRFMSLSGFTPNIERCDSCKTALDEIEQNRVKFDFSDGRLFCLNCMKHKPKYGMSISKGTLKQLFWINNSEIKRAERIKFPLFAIKEGEILLESFIQFHIGREFNSIKFLKRLRQEK